MDDSKKLKIIELHNQFRGCNFERLRGDIEEIMKETDKSIDEYQEVYETLVNNRYALFNVQTTITQMRVIKANFELLQRCYEFTERGDILMALKVYKEVRDVYAPRLKVFENCSRQVNSLIEKLKSDIEKSATKRLDKWMDNIKTKRFEIGMKIFMDIYGFSGYNFESFDRLNFFEITENKYIEIVNNFRQFDFSRFSRLLTGLTENSDDILSVFTIFHQLEKENEFFERLNPFRTTYFTSILSSFHQIYGNNNKRVSVQNTSIDSIEEQQNLQNNNLAEDRLRMGIELTSEIVGQFAIEMVLFAPLPNELKKRLAEDIDFNNVLKSLPGKFSDICHSYFIQESKNKENGSLHIKSITHFFSLFCSILNIQNQADLASKVISSVNSKYWLFIWTNLANDTQKLADNLFSSKYEPLFDIKPCKMGDVNETIDVDIADVFEKLHSYNIQSLLHPYLRKSDDMWLNEFDVEQDTEIFPVTIAFFKLIDNVMTSSDGYINSIITLLVASPNLEPFKDRNWFTTVYKTLQDNILKILTKHCQNIKTYFVHLRANQYDIYGLKKVLLLCSDFYCLEQMLKNDVLTMIFDNMINKIQRINLQLKKVGGFLELNSINQVQLREDFQKLIQTNINTEKDIIPIVNDLFIVYATGLCKQQILMLDIIPVSDSKKSYFRRMNTDKTGNEFMDLMLMKMSLAVFPIFKLIPPQFNEAFLALFIPALTLLPIHLLRQNNIPSFSESYIDRCRIDFETILLEINKYYLLKNVNIVNILKNALTKLFGLFSIMGVSNPQQLMLYVEVLINQTAVFKKSDLILFASKFAPSNPNVNKDNISNFITSLKNFEVMR
eukprot:TRINITY_DN9242_c0_g1_i1.p1 TRINITY_DN9242_c0_g1~~TRINITY_DN9242_c0_g1_i1.p1  ORF type:complete len:838 (-),score=177.90 TRINITY_DN9242_c0_g1_i1:23-2536(-)